MREDTWIFALRFTPYYKIDTALNNLEVVRAAMIEAVLALNAAKAGMETAAELEGFKTDAYARERSRATSNLLNFSALYASYVDVCRRIRGYAKLKDDAPYRRALSRLIGGNSGGHEFIKGFRNFILHHHLLEPEVKITYSQTRSTKLYLDSNALLYSGFKWTTKARHFIQKDVELDVTDAVNAVIRDVKRLIMFHRKMIEARLPEEKRAYEIYTYERERLRHLQSVASDIGAAFFKRSTPIVSRLIDSKTIENVLNSLLSDEEVRLVLCALANKHKNLPPITQNSVATGVDRLLKSRIKYKNTGAYLQGRPFK
ncbi:hypothetical protein [Salipiger abyssi]|uniref:hypothetical protein n=1 Tax=Salipiger abyssi TaxID=1250539 RepID=UPI001A90A619|nr:hypothetical protein [Salipiger abyssi]MBN9890160.1 hypothetical protein [Salipiger abyssi]